VVVAKTGGNNEKARFKIEAGFFILILHHSSAILRGGLLCPDK
jgi:hypothetical protein